jgi:type I restriction enzyme S subunit
MAGKRHRATVGDYVTLVRGTTYKGALVGGPGPALLGLGSIEPGGGFRSRDYKTYGGDCPSELMLYPGDLFASLKGATKDNKMIGSVARVPPSVPSGRITQDTVKLVFRRPEAKESSFLYWILRTPQYRQYCDGHAMGSAVVALSRHDFLSYPVPELTLEREIAVALLDALEQRQEATWRLGETLEAMARRLFKAWLVDFEPVRAKAEGRDPGVPSHIASLFPDRLVETEEGSIPVGWEFKPLSQIADFINGLALQKFPASDPKKSLPVIKIAELRNGVTERSDRASCDIPSRYIVRDGDFLFSWSGSLLAKFWTEGDGALNQHLFKVTSSRYPTWFFAEWVQHHLAEFQGIASSKATTMGHIQRSHLDAAMTCCPPVAVIDKLGRIIEPLVSRNIQIALTSRTVAALRDAVLSRLDFGKLQMKDAERFVKERDL